VQHKGQKVIQDTKTGYARWACASITCARAEKRPRNDQVSSEISWHGGYPGNRKTLGL